MPSRKGAHKMHYRRKTHTMSKVEYKQLTRDIYLANCYLTAERKRKEQHKGENKLGANTKK